MDNPQDSYGVGQTTSQYLYQPNTPFSHLHPQSQPQSQTMNTPMNTTPCNSYQSHNQPHNTWPPGSLPPNTQGATQEHMMVRHPSHHQYHHYHQIPQQQAPLYQEPRYPGGGDMPQNYYFPANAVFEQGVSRQRGICSHDPGMPYMIGQTVYQGNTKYMSSSSRGPPYGPPPGVSQPLLALPAPAITHKPEVLDDAVVPPARSQPMPNTDPYPPDQQSRAQARANNRRATMAPTGGTPPPQRSTSQARAPPLSCSPRAQRDETMVRGLSSQPSNSVPASRGITTPGPPRPTPVETTMDGDIELPPQSPIEIYDPASLPFGDMNDTEMEGNEEDNVVEVSLNMDVPKTTRHAEGKPIVTVLNVQSSWHCVFVESIQHERVHTAVRVQFCVSPECPGKVDLVKRLKTVQVIGYESRQVEMSQRIVGERLLARGGITVHLDPALISYNKNASYGFSLSFSSHPLGLISSNVPDEKLPLQKQQHAAYCRRNLKEMYYDNASKDVAIYIMKPVTPRSGTETERQPQNQGGASSSSSLSTFRPPSRAPSVGLSTSTTPAPDNQSVPTTSSTTSSHVLEVFYAHSVILECYEYFRSRYETAAVARDQAIAAASASDEGFARPLHEQLQSRSGSSGNQGPSFLSSSSSSTMPPPLRPSHQQQQQQERQGQGQGQAQPNSTERVQICLDNVQPNVFRAVLHFMYIGQVPTAVPKKGATTTTAQDETNQEAPSSSTTSATTTGGIKDPLDFTWRQLFEASVTFDIKELSHMACLVLVTDLRRESVLPELFDWAYQFPKLVPLYIEFVVQHVPRQVLERRGCGGGQGQGEVVKSALWQFRDSPAFDRMLQEILRVLAMRKPVLSL